MTNENPTPPVKQPPVYVDGQDANKIPCSLIRINKAIADSGYCARRKADDLVSQGRVSVNGEAVREAGFKVDPTTASITIDGKPLPKPAPVYLMLHKPVGYVTTRRPQGRRQKSVYELLPPSGQSADPAGRLDEDSSGLLIFSGDGDFLHQLTHPRFHWPKIYEVQLNHPLSSSAIQQLLKGVPLQPEDRIAKMSDIQLDTNHSAMYRITLLTGYNRQIRRTIEAVGYRVLSLQRISFGPLSLEGLQPGAFRMLTDEEKRLFLVSPLKD